MEYIGIIVFLALITLLCWMFYETCVRPSLWDSYDAFQRKLRERGDRGSQYGG